MPILRPLQHDEAELKTIIERIDRDRRIESDDDYDVLLLYLLSCDDEPYENTYLIEHPQTELEKQQNRAVNTVKLCRFVYGININTARTILNYAYEIGDTSRENPLIVLIVNRFTALDPRGPECVIDELFLYAARASPRCAII